MTDKKMNILICSGGTGGHIIPALAVANELINKGHNIHWLGTKKDLEAYIIPKTNIPISYISIGGFRRKDFFTKLMGPFNLVFALLQSIRILIKLKPDLVLGMGGFVAGPGGFAAWLLRIPLIIHEQNAVSGGTNRILARFAKKVLEGFPNSFHKNINAEFTGNPVRRDFLELPPPTTRFAGRSNERLKLLIVGGSRGALALNQYIPKTLRMLGDANLEVWHQTGLTHLEPTQKLYKTVTIPHKVEPFIDNMAAAYAWADLVICRAGALTIAELTAAGVGSILIPYPYAVDDHQTKNAKYLSDAGAAIIIQQRDLTVEKLCELLNTFIKERSRLIVMAQAAYNKANPQSLDKVVSYCLA